MPKESLSVYLTAVDKMSPVLASITDKTKSLDKESQELQQTFEALQKANKGLIDRKVELRKELKAVNEEVKAAKKSFEELGDEVSSDAYNKALEKQQKLKDEIAGTTKALQENQKVYKENIETIRKGGADQGVGLSGLSGLGTVVAGLGIWNQVSSLVESGAGALLESSLGNGLGGIASGALSSAISGAVLGNSIAPGGFGAAIGAASGGLLGAVGGWMEEMGNKDDAFKDYYGGLYEDVKGRSGEMVSAGSDTAGGREKDRIFFSTLFGDQATADSYLSDLVDMANHTPFLYDDLTAMSKTLATYGYGAKDILPTLTNIGDTGAALGLSTSDMTMVATALGRMKSSDKASLEYLNILNDRGIGAVGMLADAKGVSVGDMYGMISKGSISGTEAVEIITAAMKDAYAGSMEEQSRTFEGLSSTLEGLTQELQNTGGDSYNTLRKEGLQSQIDAYDGALGDSIKEINSVMAENQARKENLQDQYMREVLDAVLNGNHGSLWSTFDAEQQNTLSKMAADYASYKAQYDKSGGTDTEAAAQMESLYEQAQVNGQAYFENSEFMQILNETEENEIDAIRDNTAGLENATQAAYRVEQALSKGYGAVYTGAGGEPDESKLSPYLTGGTAQRPNSGSTPSLYIQNRSYAYGLDRVPYDDYPALLHEGERVLTASEARAQSAGSTVILNVSGNSFVGAPEEQADQLWSIIVGKLEREQLASAPK